MDQTCCSDSLSINIKSFWIHKPATDVHCSWRARQSNPISLLLSLQRSQSVSVFHFLFYPLSMSRTFLPWKEKYSISQKKREEEELRWKNKKTHKVKGRRRPGRCECFSEGADNVPSAAGREPLRNTPSHCSWRITATLAAILKPRDLWPDTRGWEESWNKERTRRKQEAKPGVGSSNTLCSCDEIR